MEALVGRCLVASSALRMSKLRSKLLVWQCAFGRVENPGRRSCARSPDMQGQQNLKNATKYW